MLKALLEASDDINGTGFLYSGCRPGRHGYASRWGDRYSVSTDEDAGESAGLVEWDGTALTINDNNNPQVLSLSALLRIQAAIGNDLTLVFSGRLPTARNLLL